MIVRNEQKTIRGCIGSVRAWIDRYAIVDTGSTDLTIDLARQLLRGYSGRILRSQWRNDFSWHRNAALQLAKDQLADARGGIVLFIDADERLLGRKGHVARELHLTEHEVLWAYAKDEEYRYLKLLAASAKVCLHWRGNIHEQLGFQDYATHHIAKDIQICYGHNGFRRRNRDTLQSDISRLKLKYAETEIDFRNLYFLARTFESAGIFDQAAEHFELAYQHASNAEETFQSLWGKLRTLSAMHEDAKACELATKIIDLTLGQRAEPLIFMARQALAAGKTSEAIILAHAALNCPIPWGSQMYDSGANGWKAYATLAQGWQDKGRGIRSRHYWRKAMSCPDLTPAIGRKLALMMHTRK